jgi:hypothetical protein
MNLYTIEKKKFNEFHSSFHKLLNSIKNVQEKNSTFKNKDPILLEFMEINEIIDILQSKVIHLTETLETTIHNDKHNSKKNKLAIENIQKDNKAIKDLIPLLFLYRMSLDK